MGKIFCKPVSLSDQATHYCPGCTHGVIHRLVAEVIDELGVRGRTVGIAPVGCAVFVNNAVYGMTGGQMAPTTMPNQRTTTSPFGRNVEEVGMPIKVAELISALETPAFISRQSVIKPKYVVRAKKAIKRAFQYQIEKRCFSLVEVVSTCPTNWGMTPVEAVQWAEDVMHPYYQLGDKKSPDPIKDKED